MLLITILSTYRSTDKKTIWHILCSSTINWGRLVTSSILHSTVPNADISICACVELYNLQALKRTTIIIILNKFRFQFTWVALRVFHGDVESEPRVRSSIVRNLGLLCIQWHTWLKSHFRYTGLQLENIWWATLICSSRLTIAYLHVYNRIINKKE